MASHTKVIHISLLIEEYEVLKAYTSSIGLDPTKYSRSIIKKEIQNNEEMRSDLIKRLNPNNKEPLDQAGTYQPKRKFRTL